MSQTPSIGRIVHYQAYGTPGGEHPSKPRAAVITDLHENNDVTVCVLNPTGMFFNRGVAYSEVPKGGTWRWPTITK